MKKNTTSAQPVAVPAISPAVMAKVYGDASWFSKACAFVGAVLKSRFDATGRAKSGNVRAHDAEKLVGFEAARDGGKPVAKTQKLAEPFPSLTSILVARSVAASADEAVDILRAICAAKPTEFFGGDATWVCRSGSDPADRDSWYLTTDIGRRDLLPARAGNVSPETLDKLGIPSF
jgi:hypothetical protein